MKKIEIQYDKPIICPVCESKVLDGTILELCPHVLLMATDEGLEFCSEKLDKQAIDKMASDISWDTATDKINFSEAVKYAKYQSAPSHFGVYFIFEK